MGRMAGIIAILYSAALFVGCAQTPPPAPAPKALSTSDLAGWYVAKAREFEDMGDLTAAVEQYRLALTVDMQNPTANENIIRLQTILQNRSEEHYQLGLEFYQKGEYSRARRAFLTALRYNPDHPDALRILKEQRLYELEIKGYLARTIQTDETISVLAKEYYGDTKKFQVIAEYNQMEDATKIRPGQEVKIPIIDGIPFFKSTDEQITLSGDASEGELTNVINIQKAIVHIVQPNESLSKLALRYYGDYNNFSLLAQYNQLSEDTSLKVGQEIKVPEIIGMPFMEKTAGADETKTKELLTGAPTVTPEETQVQHADFEEAARYRDLGLELFEEKKFDNAIIAFNKTLEKCPDDSVSLEYLSASHFQQGLIYFGKEDYLAARDEFQRSLQYNKECDKCEEFIAKSEETYMDVHYKKGLVHFTDEELTKAFEEWDLVYQMNPEYKDVAQSLKKVRILIERLESIKRSKMEEDKQ